MNKKLFVVSLLAILTACGQQANENAADVVFTNAKIYTVNDEHPWAETVAVKGNEIVYVGDAAGAEALIGESTEVNDVGGKLILPGMIDAHAHPISGGGYATALSLDTGGTVEEWVADIDAYAKANPDDDVLFGYGFLASTFGPAGPTRQQIDAVVPDRPVLIIDEGLHGAWANTAALTAMNITQDTPDPAPNFSYYKRDENGDATGYLLEGTAHIALDALNIMSEERIAAGMAVVVDIMNQYGVTAAFDAGSFGGLEETRAILARVESDGAMSIRLFGASMAASQDQFGFAAENAIQYRRTISGDHYRYTTLKIMNDGTVEGRTAAMFEDYQGEPGNSGELVFTEEQVTAMIVDAISADLDIHIHALGERAVHEALNSIEAARAAHPNTQSRFAITHLQVIADQDLARFAELDVIAQSTPLWAAYDYYGKQFVSDDQFERYWRFKSLVDSGARFTSGSDFPASGAGSLGLSPMMQIEIGHTRQEPGVPDSLVQPRESERLSVEALVRAHTIDAAYQLHADDQIGSIEVGKKADLVVLDQNIFEIDAYSIHKTEVVLTMMDGEVVYEMPDS